MSKYLWLSCYNLSKPVDAATSYPDLFGNYVSDATS